MRTVLALALTLLPVTRAAGQDIDSLVLAHGSPLVVRSGSALQPGLVILALKAGNPVPNVPIKIRPIDGAITLEGDSVDTDMNGLADFRGLRVSGAAGDVQLAAVVGRHTLAIPRFVLAAGVPNRIVVLAQPSTQVISEKRFAQQPKIRVEDAAGNFVIKEEVAVEVVVDSKRAPSTFDLASKVQMRSDKSPKAPGELCDRVTPVGRLTGTTTRLTDADGVIQFDSLGFSGRCGYYRLRFSSTDASPEEDVVVAESEGFSYDSEHTQDRNFVEIGAIKTLAGEVPENEFFALRFKFRLTGPTERHPANPTFFAMAAVDIALSNRESEDSVGSSQKYLTEANLSANLQLWKWRDQTNDIPDRSVYAGLLAKVFNTIPYAGVQVGALEMGGSPFEGSSLALAFLRSLYSTPVTVDGTSVRPQDYNFYVDFYLRSGTIDFFKVLTIRGGVLLPIGRGVPTASRIAILVPLQTLKSF